MATKYIFFNTESRDAIKQGIDKATDAIAVSLGVDGKCVVIHSSIGNKITKDGFSISKAINLDNEIEKIGANFTKEVAKKAVDLSGDGTSSASILFRDI